MSNDNENICSYFLFIKSGLCIFDKKLNNENIINEEKYNHLKILLRKISIKLLNKNINSDLFIFNKFLFNKYKIVILLKSKLALVGLFPINSKNDFQNLLLIHLYISLINFKGDSINKINSINKYIKEKNDNNIYYTFKQFIEENKDQIKNNLLKSVSSIDFLELLIYDKYFLKYCIIHFQKVIELLTKREDIDLTYTKFMNLYIIDISTDKILFDFDKMQNINNIKYYNNKNIYEEILYHSHQLHQAYIEKYSMKFVKGDSSHRFIKFECTSTYPRLLFIIRFIPILKGIIIVHIYYQKKLSRTSNNNNSTINNEIKYKEVDLVFGSVLNENNSVDLKYIMPKKLSEIERFCEEFFITTRNCEMFKLNEPQKEFKYFNYNIINIINSIPIDVVNDDYDKIFQYINEQIKSKYIDEYNKFLNKKSNIGNQDKTLVKDENSNNSIIFKKSFDKFLIDKNIIYKDLFENNINYKNIFNIELNDKNNFSTIKSNKNIINLLRENDKTINNNKNKNSTKENKSIPSDIKTITLMSESNLLSKEDDCSKNIMMENVSLISEIKKNDSINYKSLSRYHKKDNINLKKIKFQDLLNNSTNKNAFSSLNNIKEKSKIIEESESDVINKDNSNNLIIKDEEGSNGKIRNKLKLFDNNMEPID